MRALGRLGAGLAAIGVVVACCALRPAVVATLAGFAVALVGGGALAPAFGIGGVALAVSAGALLHAGLIAAALQARGLWKGAGLAARIRRVGAATLMMALALRPLQAMLPASALALAFLCIAGTLLYGGFALICGAVPPDWRGFVRKAPGSRRATW